MTCTVDLSKLNPKLRGVQIGWRLFDPGGPRSGLASVVCSVWTVWTKFGQKTDKIFLKFVCASTKTGNSIQNARILAQGIQDARRLCRLWTSSDRQRQDRQWTKDRQFPKKIVNLPTLSNIQQDPG
jgi:hypothetical protein